MNNGLIILDFDGTLCDTRKTIVRTLQMTMDKLCLPVADEYACAATIGLPLAESFRVLFPSLTETQALGCAEAYRDIFEENKKLLAPKVFPDVPETLRALRDRGFVLTIASSRSNHSLLDFVRTFGFDKEISLVLGADDVTKAKPDPEPVLLTLRKLGFSASRTLVVGDMPFDILMGRGAGAKTCGVTYGNSSREELQVSGADYIIDDFANLLDLNWL